MNADALDHPAHDGPQVIVEQHPVDRFERINDPIDGSGGSEEVFLEQVSSVGTRVALATGPQRTTNPMRPSG